jgi:hypothetical protein
MDQNQKPKSIGIDTAAFGTEIMDELFIAWMEKHGE